MVELTIRGGLDAHGWTIAGELAELATELHNVAESSGLTTADRGRLGRLARRNEDLVKRLLAELLIADGDDVAEAYSGTEGWL